MDRSTTVGEMLADPAARAVVDRYLPGVMSSPAITSFTSARLGQLVMVVPATREDPALAQAMFDELADLGDGAGPAYLPAVEPDPGYDGEDVARGSAVLTLPTDARRWSMAEIRLQGPAHGNPFVDVELTATVRHGGRELTVGGVYDGDGRYLLRVLPDEEGEWSFTTTSTARSLDAITGSFEVGAAAAAEHGPVQADGFHFRHADGTVHRPLGTTCYVWNHQSVELQEQTLATLAEGPFRKIRMCVFPKFYDFNREDPERFPFLRREDGSFDLERFDVEFFQGLDAQIARLGELGIEADLILFHPYDRWGFADMGAAVDDRVVQYVVRRLAGYPNVWWSLANEYDLMWAKTIEDWERIAAGVQAQDPFGHLLSIHQCFRFYDHTRPWITHASVQRVDVYRTAENVDDWRRDWGKPVVVDECGYEGDIEHGWGNISGEELTRRFWEGAVRGGYVGHGETYLADDEVLWWSKGGVLKGSSPERIAFLERVLAASPTGVLDPLPSEWDVPWGGVEGEYGIGYLGFSRPRSRSVTLPEGEFAVDVIDTWNMTIDELPGTHTGQLRVPLPGREHMAIRYRRLA